MHTLMDRKAKAEKNWCCGIEMGSGYHRVLEREEEESSCFSWTTVLFVDGSL